MGFFGLIFMALIAEPMFRGPVEWWFAMLLGVFTWYGLAAYNQSVKKRFLAKRFEALHNGCVDRLHRFDDVLKSLRKNQIADLQEMPRTIKAVSQSVYCALRRADLISHEVSKTENGILAAPPTWQGGSNDAQAKELYRIADKNIAEYRTQFAGVMAGVQRTEAQAAVYMTTLDSLRMKMIGHRLTGRGPEMSSQEFLEALSEARTQLQAIDSALDELDFSHFPKTISVVPPPMPEDVFDPDRMRQGR